jgi:hypothetical protein
MPLIGMWPRISNPGAEGSIPSRGATIALSFNGRISSYELEDGEFDPPRSYQIAPWYNGYYIRF